MARGKRLLAEGSLLTYRPLRLTALGTNRLGRRQFSLSSSAVAVAVAADSVLHSATSLAAAGAVEQGEF
jgi:hypothetical protein